MKTEMNNNYYMPEGFEKTAGELLQLAKSFGAKNLNIVPFKDSWTGAQVIDHITRSNRSIAQALDLAGKPVDRDAAERKTELAGVFLDFTIKFKSPDFILPTREKYDKDALILALQQSVDSLQKTAAVTTLTDAIEHPAFGEITKQELLYFVLYHTQRHTRQLQRIYEIVENRQYKMLSFLFMNPLSFF